MKPIGSQNWSLVVSVLWSAIGSVSGMSKHECCITPENSHTTVAVHVDYVQP